VIDTIITLEEASTLLNVNKQTLRRWDDSGTLKSLRNDAGYRVYKYEDVLKLLHKKEAKPFVKWAGGKTKLVPEILKYLPEKYNNYIEPFVGGGALFFALKPKKAILNDINSELIATYKVIQKKPEELIFLLEDYQKKHNKDFYYKTRSTNVESLDDVEVAARFVYLNKTCFNGLYRVNQKNEFNVPMGSYKNPTILDEENILKCSRAFKNVEFYNMDYRDFLSQFAKPNDFVYLDPPYIPVSEYSDFDRYSKEKFKIFDQVELVTQFNKLIQIGAHPLLSNSSAPLTEKIYSDYNIKKVMASRFINKAGDKRGKVEEFLILPSESKKDLFPSTRYMGSKNNLIQNIADVVAPLKINSVLDAFSGSGVVSYQFKKMGYQVFSNDFLKYSSTVTKALVENQKETLTSEDIEQLLEKNKHSKKFIQTCFKGLYFEDADNVFLDNTLANIQNIKSENKRSIALASLSRACLKRRPRGIFTYVGFRYDDGRKDLSYSLKEHFLFSVSDFNKAVFNNGKDNKVFNKSILDLNEVQPDLVYLDPPYFSKHSDNDYVRRYHFIEGLCRNWQGLEIQEDTLTKKFKKFESPFNTKEGTYSAFDWIFKKYKKSKLLVSYSSNSLPTKEEMVEMLYRYKTNVEVIEIDYKYSFGNQGHKVDDNKNSVKEYLFLAT
jgi:DNA adenine methylase